MQESRFLAQPDFNRLPGYPIAIGHIFDVPTHCVKGMRYPLHHYHFHLVMNGKGWLKTPTGTIELTSGSGFLYSENQIQWFGSDKDKPWDVWWVMFGGNGMRELLGDKSMGEEAWVFSFTEAPRIPELVKELWQLAGQTKVGTVPRTAALLQEVVLELLLHTSSLQVSRKPTLEHAIRRTAEYMSVHLNKKLTLPVLAEYCGISPSYFSRMFHAHFGVPPLTYLNIRRIELAKQMLSATSKSIKQIALEVGFSQPSYFIERFRESEGITPVGYRDSHQ